MTAKDSSRWWWFDSHNSSKRSPWLHSTLTGVVLLKRIEGMRGGPCFLGLSDYHHVGLLGVAVTDSSFLSIILFGNRKKELDEKTKAMLKLIEEDADSFAQRAEMYYKKKPELISMVEDFYRAHRSLAERYDQVKSETGTRLLTTCGSPFISIKHNPQKLMNVMDQTYYSYSGTSDPEDYAESEVDDPVQEDEIRVENETEEVLDSELENEPEVEDSELGNEPEVEKEMKEDEGPEWDQELKEDSVSSEICDDEIMRLREEIEEVVDPEQEDEIQVYQKLEEDSVSSKVSDEVEFMKLKEELERLKEENVMQRNQLMQKDEEKREVIRQLSMTIEMLKDENVKLRKYIARESPKKQNPFEFSKLKAFFRRTT